MSGVTTIELTRERFTEELGRRMRAVQRAMKEKNLKMLLAACVGAPGQTGWLRYLTGGELWSGQGFVLIAADNPEPLIIVRSNYMAEWIRTLAPTSRVESTLLTRSSVIQRVIEVTRQATGGNGRIGAVGAGRSMYVGDYAAFREALPGLEIVDMEADINRLRQIKSPFEIEAMRDMGRILVEGFRIFEEHARPGVSALEVSGMVEGHLKGKGCVWGRAKYSLDQRPYTWTAAIDRRLVEDDVILFQYVYSSPYGYWYEVARLYSFKDLPPVTARRYQAMDAALHETARMAKPGCTYGEINEASDRIFRDHGLTVIGKHTEDVHSIGTDISDGPPWYTDDWEIKENMVLALHPASLVEGDFAFFLCENYVVEKGGAIPLSPLESFYAQLPVK